MAVGNVFRWTLIVVATFVSTTFVVIFVAVGVDSQQMSRPANVIGLLIVGVSILCVASAFPLAIYLWRVMSTQRKRAANVLSFVEQAVILNLPLPRIFESLGETAPGSSFELRMRSARVAIEEGAPLAAVLGHVPAMPERAIRLISSAEKVGRLPQVMGRLMRQRREALLQHRYLTFEMTYPVMVGLAVLFVTSLFMIYVGPKFEKIALDFHIELPSITRTLFNLWRSVGGVIWIVFTLVLIAYFVLIRSPLRANLGFVESRRGWILNRLPWIGTIRFYRGLGDVLDFAADAVEGGRPIGEALLEAGQIPVNTRVSTKVVQWVTFMNEGRSLADAATDAGLPPLIGGMLTTSRSADDTAQTLHFLGRYYASRFSRSLEVAKASVAPVSALVMGVIVGWLVFAMFAPLLSLVEVVSGPTK